MLMQISPTCSFTNYGGGDGGKGDERDRGKGYGEIFKKTRKISAYNVAKRTDSEGNHAIACEEVIAGVQR